MTYIPKVIPLNSKAHTPELVLNRTQQKLEHIKSVVIVIHWKDDSVAVDWSNMKTSELCLASMVLQETTQRELTGDEHG
jgi:hypothetical protein